MKLAHEIPTPPQVQESTSDTDLFRWNRKDISQFLLVDSLSQGWSVRFVEASGPVPEHIKLTAPTSWSNMTGPVFLLVTPDLASPNHQISATHDMLDPDLYEYELGILDRYESSRDFVGAWWHSYPRQLPRLQVGEVENGIEHIAHVIPENPGLLGVTPIQTQSRAIGGLHGCGLGRISGHGFCGAAQGDPTVGFVISSIAALGDHGGEAIRIFDFTAKRVADA